MEPVLKFLIFICRILPLNLISYLTGRFSKISRPKWLVLMLNRAFVSAFKIDMNLAEREIEQYDSLLDLFTRKLKKGLRPVESALVSPADGALTNSGECVNGQAVQFKKMTYSVAELVFADEPPNTDLSWFFTVYLSPQDYHRVHSPVSGNLVSIRYVPGKLFAVNATFASLVPNLFSKNERMVFEVELDNGGRVFVAMIGALNVGAIQSSHFPEWVTNDWQRQVGRSMEYKRLTPEIPIEAGDELGTFMLGSTAVVVLDRTAEERFSQIRRISQAEPVTMGKSLLEK